MTKDELLTAITCSDIPTGNSAKCEWCSEEIFEVIDPYSGTVDWGTKWNNDELPGDFGCGDNPETNEEGSGSHKPPEPFQQPGEIGLAI